jgi:signal transduction histidine kinase
LDSIVGEFTQKFYEKNITLERTDQVPNLSLTTDERLLHIIFSNLLSNATKYVKESGTITMTTGVVDNQFVFHIVDDGIGIPKEEVDKLFTKFYRASNATKHQTEGTGLGLYVIKQALELLGGTIALETDTEQGADFIVILPITS